MAFSDTAQVIEQLQDARRNFRAALDRIDPETVVYADTGWRVRDLVGHMALWYGERIRTLRAYQQGQEYRIPGFAGGAAYNQQDYEARKNLPYDEVVGDWEQAHTDLLAILRELPDSALDDETMLPWGERGTIALLLERLIAHEREHGAEIQQAG